MIRYFLAILLFAAAGPAIAQQASALPFQPSPGQHCQDETTSSTSASVVLPTATQYQVYLAPSVTTYAQFSRTGSTAVTGKGVQLPAGVVMVLTAPLGAASFDYVSATSGTMNICVGQGN